MQLKQQQTLNPSQDQMNALANLYHSHQIIKIEKICRDLMLTHPKSFIVTNLLGIALQGQGKLQEAIQVFNKTIHLNSDYAEAYYNRGNALRDLDQLKEAIANYDQSIRLKPDFAEAYCNRGNALRDLDQLKEAIANYDQSIRLKPDFAEAYCNRGNALNELGNLNEAIENYQKAISINPNNFLFWNGFANVLRVIRFKSYSDDLGYFLIKTLEQKNVRPKNIIKAVISALHHHPIVLHVFRLFTSKHSKKDINYFTTQLSSVPLLLRVMELSPIADLNIEKIFTRMRKAMLHKAVSGNKKTEDLLFYTALATHCFINEYVFFESEEEKKEINLLELQVKTLLIKGNTVPQTWIALLSSYRPLYSFSWAEHLLKHEWSDEIKKIIKIQLNNFNEEKSLRTKIPRLASIENKVSQLVRNQYEENPYPRWVKTGLSYKPKTIKKVLQSIKFHMNFDSQKFSNKPDILVAGCGTGQHALSTASRFLNCNVLAIDLSLNSLSYAIRKTQELKITNIKYMQGDLLKIDQLKRKFDIIESVGVLHHFHEPLVGWRILVDRLRTGGLMNIGLYSDIAREHIVEARKQIAKKKYTSSLADIKKYREEIFNINNNSNSIILKVLDSTDFYSMSACRDLLFHIQEHRFTLLQIEAALNNLGLKFLGFELKQSWVKSKFFKLYPEKNAQASLSLWHQFEIKYPNAFRGMYQFWVQKV